MSQGQPEPNKWPGSNQPVGKPVGQTNMHPAAAASEQTAASAASSSKQQEAVSQPADSRVVLRGVALLYEFPAETRSAVYCRSQHLLYDLRD